MLDFNPSEVIDMIAPRPMLIVGNAGGPFDWVHPPEPIQQAFAKAGEPKRIVFLPYGAFGLYTEPGRSDSLATILPFLDEHLKHPSPVGRVPPVTQIRAASAAAVDRDARERLPATRDPCAASCPPKTGRHPGLIRSATVTS